MKSSFPLMYISMAVIAIMFFSCSEDTIDPERYGNITGTVLDSRSKNPIVDASITTTPATTSILTNDEGDFSFEQIPVGEYTIFIEKSGYSNHSVKVSVKEGKDTHADIMLEKKNETYPGSPTSPVPANEALNQPLTIWLAWTCPDSDVTDTLKFSVFLYESGETEKQQIAAEIADTSVAVQDLQYHTTYYWQVIAIDDEGHETKSDVWSFKTLPMPDLPMLYVNNVGDDYDIYACDLSGEHIIRLTNNQSREWYPRISPDKEKIAFVSTMQLETYIYTMNYDGSNPKKISTLPVAGNHNNGIGFCWSPDGSKIIFPYYDKLYKINSDGSGLKSFATAPSERNFRECDGYGDSLVVLTVGVDIFDGEIYKMKSDGSGMVQVLGNLAGILEAPSYSIDGSRILFTHDVSGHESVTGRQLDARIFVMNTDGTGLTDLSTNKPSGTNDLHPRFSKDGSKIVFENASNVLQSTKRLYVMDIEGNNREEITTGFFPEWTGFSE